jgi:hypothetical protein
MIDSHWGKDSAIKRNINYQLNILQNLNKKN